MYDTLEFLKPLNHEDLENFGTKSARYGLDYMVDKLKMTAADVTKHIFEISRKHLQTKEKEYLDKPLWLLNNKKCAADLLLEKGIKDTASLVEYLKL